MSLRRTFFDTMAMSLVSLMRLLAQFVAVPVLSRILSPEEYGLVAMAMPFILFSMMLADAGIGASLVRTPQDSKPVWASFFWLTVMLGAALWALMTLAAPFAAQLLEEPRLTPLVSALAVVVFFQAIACVPSALLQKQQHFRRVAAIDIFVLIAGIIVAIWSARHGYGAWALVHQQLACYGLRMVLVFFYSGFRPEFMFARVQLREHFAFSRNVLSVNVVGFFTRSVDNVIIGKILGAASTGVYSMALQFARLPVMLISGPLNYVLYAKLSHVKDDRAAVCHTFMVITRVLASVIFPGMAMVAAAHKPIFELLLSAKWADSGVIFMLATPACATLSVTMLCGTIMLVLGRADIQLKTTYEFGLLWIITLLASAPYGVACAAMAFNFAVWAYTPRLILLVFPLMGASAAAYIRVLFIPVAIASLCVGSYFIIHRYVPMHDVWLIILAGFLACAGIAASLLVQLKALQSEMALCGSAFSQYAGKGS